MKTLLIVDDHPIVLEGIQSVMSKNDFKVLKATTADQAIAIAEQVTGIDMYVVDLSLKEGTDGITLIDTLREKGFYRPTVVYTMHEELWNIAILMKTDVEGIVLKGDNINELVYAVKTVAEGNRYQSSAFDEKRKEALNTTGILSSKDIEILRRLSAGAGNREIASEMQISEKTVEYHRANILRKLRAKTMLEATKRAIALGIIYVSMVTAVMTPQPATAAETAPEAVDLGLSVDWADRNLGADTPLDAGDYYAFAETETKETYDWTTYIHCAGEIGTCHDLGTDNIAGTHYDPATLMLGDGWRMPTAAECEELVDACTFANAQYGDTCAVTFTSPDTGKHVILPLAGYMTGARLYTFNTEGAYMTGTCEFESYEDEWNDIGNIAMLMNGNMALVTYGSPQLGVTIRPVKEKASTSAAPSLSATPATVTQVYTVDGKSLGSSIESLPSRGIFIILMSDGRCKKIVKK